MSDNMKGWESGQILVVDGNDEYYRSVFVNKSYPYAIFMEFEFGHEERPTWGVIDTGSRYIVRRGCFNFAEAQKQIAALMQTNHYNRQVVTIDELEAELEERMYAARPLPDRMMVLVDRLNQTLAKEI